MKVTNRRLRKLIRETIGQSRGTITGSPAAGPNAGVPYIDIVVSALADGDTDTATQSILNSFMMDDTWPKEEDALEGMLAALGPDASREDVEAVAAEWADGYRAGKFRPAQEQHKDQWNLGAERSRSRAKKAGPSWEKWRASQSNESSNLTVTQLRRIIREAISGMPAGNVIGYIEADIDGDHRYNQQLRVIHNPGTDEITIIVQDAGAVGGMDYHGPGEGRSDYYTHGRPQVLPAGTKGKDLVAAIRNVIKQTADTIKRYGKPTRNFVWGESTWSRGPKGLNAKLATAALQKARAQGAGAPLAEAALRSWVRRRLLKELDFVNRESGEVIDFGEDSISGVPDAAIPDLAKRLNIDLSQEELSHDDWTKLDDEVLGKQSDREVRKRIKKFKEDEARLDPDRLLDRLQNWAHIAFQDYAADNPDTDIQDVAFDLADAARYEFEQDEWDELLWHFDGDADALKVYTAESMG